MASKTKKDEESTHVAELDAEEERLLRTLDRLRRAKARLLPHGVSKSEHSAGRIVFADCVTERHAEIFAKAFLADIRRTEVPGDAFGLTGVMDWPVDSEDESPAQMRYERIEDEILIRILDAIEQPLREAFVRIATIVIERERARG